MTLLDTAYAFTSSDVPQSTVTATYDISDVIRTVVAIIVLGSGILCVFYILWGGVMLILSGGKEDKIKPAISGIRFSVIGLLIIVLALFVLPKAGDLLGLHVSQYISPEVEFRTIKELAGKIFGGSDSVPELLDSTGKPVLPSDFGGL